MRMISDIERIADHCSDISEYIIMLSSEESTTERIRLLEEGAADYILKPFNPLELKVRIKKIID